MIKIQKNKAYTQVLEVLNFIKVEDYYKDLISRTRETPQYLYYLIDAQYRAGNKREAMENVNKAIKSNKPYPSLEELKRLRKRIASMR